MAITVVLGLSLTGLVIGALWAWVAPPIHAVVALTRAGERVHEYLGEESQNFFIAPFLMLGLSGVVAVVAAVLVWQWREHRDRGWSSRFRSAWSAPRRQRRRWGRCWFGCATARWISTRCRWQAASMR
ncbi:hypothetical protein BZL29_3284 [Mycobacterium kansasii]|uniref:Transmembrane protein n=1 Tax=Mycobacterium kansasii TaxID=1768 RepID=A0A1V3XCJ5_MYCKA|nr:hypothetical protein BZL29_3284 [Mycobacterium kansasii]